MKHNYKLLLSIFILNYSLICLGSYAQTFEKVISTNKDEVAHDAIELNNSNYIVHSIRSKGDFNNRDYDIIVYELDSTGQFIDSLIIELNNDYKLLFTRYILQCDNNELVIVGNCQKINTLDYQLYLAFLNYDLEFISDTIIGDTNKSDYLIDFLINEYGNLIAVGHCDNDSISNRVIIEYSISNKTLKRYAFYRIHYLTTVIEVPQTNAYHLFELFSGDTIIQINRDSLTIDTFYLFPNPFDAFSAINIPVNTDYLVAGKKSDYTTYTRKIAYRLMDNGGNILEDKMYGATDTNYYFALNEVDCNNSNNFFLGGTHNFEHAIPFLYPEPRWIFVNKLKLNGDIIWQNFYKGELNYMPYKILATSDGGALILSHKYDWNSPYPNQRDIHILKVDSTGYYSGMTNIDEITGKPQQILVYPNPAKDIVNIATGFYTKLQLTLYDEKGMIVLTKNLAGSTHTVNVSNLKPGLYLYRFYGERRFSESGKLVIE
jgi:hypothetical protein